MVKYIGKIVDELESLDVNAFDASTDTILLAAEKAEDAAFQDDDVGIVTMAVRDDTPPSAKGAEGDYMPLLVDSKGQLYVIGEHDLAIKNAIQIIDDWDDGADHAEIKEYFGGAAFSKHYTVSDTPTLFEASEKKLRDVVIRNVDAAEGARIGIYNADKGTFRGTGYKLEFSESIGFVKINLNTLAYCSHTDGDTPILELIGTEE